MTIACEIAPFSKTSLDQAQEIWNSDGQLHPCDAGLFVEKIFEDPGVQPEARLAAFRDQTLVGFCVAAQRDGVDHETDRAHIKMIAVEPSYRRQRIGSALLAAVEEALVAHQIGTFRVDEAAPNYLTPGINQKNTIARQFFEAHGYEVTGEAVNMAVDLSDQEFATSEDEKALGKRDIVVRRATVADYAAIDKLLSAHWLAWKPEVHRALRNDPAALHIAIRDNRVVGFSAYDGNNLGTGWFGPMGTDPAEAGQGIGSVLLRRCLSDLQSQGRQHATIPWVGPVGFYERHCHAVVSDEFWRMGKQV